MKISLQTNIFISEIKEKLHLRNAGTCGEIGHLRIERLELEQKDTQLRVRSGRI